MTPPPPPPPPPTPTPTPPSSPRGEEAPDASHSTTAAAAAADDDDDVDDDDDAADDDHHHHHHALPPPPGAHALRLDAAGLRQIRSSQQPAVVRFDRAGCAGCADLAPFWEQHVAASLPPGSAWWADCD